MSDNKLKICDFSFEMREDCVEIIKNNRFSFIEKDFYIIKTNQIIGITQVTRRLMRYIVTPLLSVVIGIIICIVINLGWGVWLLGFEDLLFVNVWGILIVLIGIFFIFIWIGFKSYNYYSLRYSGGEIRLSSFEELDVSNLSAFFGLPIPSVIKRQASIQARIREIEEK